MNDIPQFFFCNFKRTMTVQMNAAMALELFRLIRTSPAEAVSKELFAFTERMKTQLYHMKHLKELEEIENAIRTIVGDSESKGGGDNTGASSDAAGTL